MSGALPVAGPQRLLSTVVTMALGTAGVLGLLLAMNQPAAAPPAQGPRAPVTFEVKAPPPPKAKKTRPQPQRRPPKRSPAPPAPMLSAGLPGLSFGLPGLDGGMGPIDDSLLGKKGGGLMTAESVDQPPRLSRRVEVTYPPRARAKGVTGSVTLSLIVQVDGSVEDVRVLESIPPGVFDAAAQSAVRQWRFEPGTYEGRAVAVRAQQTLRFDLN